jgi:hypothetical protein
MRHCVWTVLVAVVLAMSGCGGSEEVGKPDSLTEDEIREMDRVQQEVDVAEREQRKLNP